MGSHSPTEEQPGQNTTDVPRWRSHYDETSKNERSRPKNKWEKDQKVWMRVSKTEPFDFLKWVNAFEYNEENQWWDYKLRDHEGKIYKELVPEDNTRRA